MVNVAKIALFLFLTQKMKKNVPFGKKMASIWDGCCNFASK